MGQSIASLKDDRADRIAKRTVVSLEPGGSIFYPMNGSMNLQSQVLADPGTRTISPKPDRKYDVGEVAAEAFGDLLGQVDGLLLATTTPGDLAGLENEPLWQRLPAVENGALVASNGNINYGSIYSAIQVAKFVDELYGKLA